ncbi:MAG: hypothetical protein EOM20_06275 [Spartobacteria bacterium]|nr:hypothetical protein [Spartobacteria bacterium]
MKRIVYISVMAVFCCVVAGAADLSLDWAYHDDADELDDRTSEQVPGEDFTFLGNGSTLISTDVPVTLYIMTAQQFGGDMDEQVFVRWWNGEAEHWIMGNWMKNIELVDLDTFHGLPLDGQVTVDVWEVTIEPEITRPGENYYTIQLKAWLEGQDPEAVFLLRDTGGGEATVNNLDQAWTAGDFSGRDWSLTITE